MEGIANEPILIGWTTTPDKDTALEISRAAIEAGLAACVQISGPLTSVYRWEGQLCEETEFRLTFKLAARHGEALQALVLQKHPYQVPQWVVVEAAHVLPAYAAWVRGG